MSIFSAPGSARPARPFSWPRSAVFSGAIAIVWMLMTLPLSAGVIFQTGSNWKMLKGWADASPDLTSWRQLDFDDSAFTDLPAPFYYGQVDIINSPPLSGGTTLPDMRNNYTSVYFRKMFVVTNAASISAFDFGVISDDGFIAWINGREVARFNMPDGDPIPFDVSSSPALQEPLPFQTFVLDTPSPATYLVEGTNVLAIHAFNSSISMSSDFGLDASLSSLVDDVPPAVTAVFPAPTAVVADLVEIEIHFSEGVTGVDAQDLLINNQPATGLVVIGADQYIFQFPQPPTGTVQVAWASNHGITDLAAPGNPFGGGSWTYTLDPKAIPTGLIINEFMAKNGIGYHDEDGVSSDWIEIYNTGSTTASLNGWFLTDRTNNLTRWRFPNVSLLSHELLVVFASGNNRTNPLAPLHTNFKLDSDGGFLALVDPKTNIISAFAPYPPQNDATVSYGRAALNFLVTGYFPTPSPGVTNSTSGPGFAPAIDFSPPGGTFYGSLSLTLSAPGTNVEIRYTLNGTPPTQSSFLYSAPLQLSNTVQVRARAYQTGLLPGPVRSEAYLGLSPTVLNFSSDLPIVIIHNFGSGAVPADADQLAYFEIFEPVNGRSSMTNAPTLRSRAGISIRGSSTAFYPKSSFKVSWWDELNDDKDLPVLGMPEESDWVMYAPNNFEPVLIHNPFIYDLSNDLGRYAPRTRFCEVYLNINGGLVSSANYNGIYVFEEKIKRDKHRVDIDKLEPEHIAPPEVTGGYIMKIDRLDPGDSGFFAANQSIAYVDPKEEAIIQPQRAPQQQYLQNYMDAFGNALYGPNYTDPVNGYPAYVDVDAWVDHHILNVLAFNVDALRLSAYFYKPRNGKLAFGPIWDFDRALDSTDGRDANPRVWRSNSGDRGTDFFNYPWWDQLFTDPNFWQKWIDRYQDLRRGPFALSNLNAKVDLMANQVRQAQPREQARWGVQPRNGSYQGEVNLMKTWLGNRLNFMDTNFLAMPVFSSLGQQFTNSFTLTVTAPPGATIYYTLDGSDPRLSGGAISSRAIAYTGPVTLTNITLVTARAYDAAHRNLTGPNNPPISSPWSGPMRARFFVNPPAAFGDLRVTEINYHPADPTPSELASNPLLTDTDFEFVELKNVSNRTIDLYSARFTAGLDFSFQTSSIVTLAPNAFLLLVKNPAAFALRYGARPNIAGSYDGSLDNEGDHLRLVDAANNPLLDFTYNDGWYPLSDGLGFTLVLRQDSAAPGVLSDKETWRSSAEKGGSPGLLNAVPLPFAGILVNETLTHTDLPLVDSVELYNPGPTNVNIGGWFLTDDRSQPRKYRIPTNTTILANGYLLFDENNFNADPNSTNSFAFNSYNGDDVYLFSADASQNLTGYAHGFDFGASANGVTFGRYVISTGVEHFVAQITNTLGRANSGPRVGPIVLNEILYDPPLLGTNNNTRDEYVELHNPGGTDAPLFDINFPTNAWRLRGSVEFDFPTNLYLQAGAYLIVAGFDPATNATVTANFRAAYKVVPGTPILGPFSGNLNNAGEKVRLLKPDPPQPVGAPNTGFVPYVLVDQIDYSNQLPWPTNANATGLSIQRRVANAYGNDPTNWVVAVATPGGANIVTPGDLDGDGLPDAWETAHGLDPRTATGTNGANGDPDGDGFANYEEYLSGTDPQNALSRLEVSSVVPGPTTTLRFVAAAGVTYTVQYRDDLGPSGAWINLQRVNAQATTGPIAVNDPSPGAQARFYRLVTPALP